MAMCSLILMSILKTGPCMVSEEEEAVFMAQCNAFASGCAACPSCLSDKGRSMVSKEDKL